VTYLREGIWESDLLPSSTIFLKQINYVLCKIWKNPEENLYEFEKNVHIRPVRHSAKYATDWFQLHAFRFETFTAILTTVDISSCIQMQKRNSEKLWKSLAKKMTSWPGGRLARVRRAKHGTYIRRRCTHSSRFIHTATVK